MKVTVKLRGNECARITKRKGGFVVERMRFLLPYQARREAQAKEPAMCHHRCRAEWTGGRWG